MKRIPFIIFFLSLLLAGCETTAPLRVKKSEFREISTEAKQSIADQSKDAETAMQETTFGDKR